MPNRDTPKRGRPSPSTRIRIKTRYLNGETDISALAESEGTTRQTIWRWMKADARSGHEWVSRKDVRNAVVTDVTQRIAKRVAADTGEKVAEELLATGEAAKTAAEYVKDILTKAKNGDIDPGEKQSAADVFNTIMSGYARFVATVREDHGLRAGQPSVPSEAGSDTKFEFVVVRDEKTA